MINIRKLSKIKRDLLFSYFTQGIAIVFGFLNIYLITYYVGIYAYGQYAILVTSVGFMSLLLTARSGEAIVKFYKKSKIESNYSNAKTYIIYGFIFDIITAIFLYEVVLLSSGFISSSLLKDVELKSLVNLFAIINILVFLKGTMLGYLQANKMFYFFNGLKIFEITTLSIVLFYTFNYVDIKLINIIQSYIYVYSLSFIFTFGIFFRYYIKEFKSIKISLSKITFYQYLKFNLITFTSSALKAGNKNFDNLILSYFTNPSMVAIYAILKKFFMPINMVSKPFQTIMYPKLTNLWYEKKYDNFQNNIFKVTKILFTIDLLYFICLFIFSDFLINLFKLDYKNTHMLIYLMIIYFSMVPLIWWSRNFSNIINPMFSLFSTSLNTVLQMTICVLFTYLFGIEGLIISLIFVKIVMVLYWVYRYKNVFESINK